MTFNKNEIKYERKMKYEFVNVIVELISKHMIMITVILIVKVMVIKNK